MTRAAMLARALVTTAAVALATSPIGAAAQGAAAAFPAKSITIVIPATPGGAIDLTARLVGPKLTEAWGRASCSSRWPASTCCTCPTRAAPRRMPTS
jgi:hypothetical protein